MNTDSILAELVRANRALPALPYGPARPDVVRAVEDLMHVQSWRTDYRGTLVIEGIIKPTNGGTGMNPMELRVNLFTIYQEIIRRVKEAGGNLHEEPAFLIGPVEGKVRASVKLTLSRPDLR